MPSSPPTPRSRALSLRPSGTRSEHAQRSIGFYGTRLTRLPWSGAAGAQAALDHRARRRHRLAVAALDECFMQDPMEGVLAALRAAVRGVVVAHGGARHRLPSWIIHDALGRASTEAHALLGNSRINMGQVRRYELEGRDRFAERPVNLSTLVRKPEDAEPLLEMLGHVGLAHQLRVVTYDEGKLAGYFGHYLPPGEAPFTLAEHAALHALLPALRLWLFTARAVGFHPFDDTGLTTALEMNDKPCFLVREDEKLVFANAAARALPLDRERRAASLRAVRSNRVRLPFGGTSLHLVALCDERQPAAPVPACFRPPRLPASLARVADGLGRGLSDKEIADELSLSLATARTYTSRVLRRLGVSSRRQLMLLGVPRARSEGA